MQIFLSIKYHSDQSNRPRIEALSAALAQEGHPVICVARDLEKWGQICYPLAELMRQTFALIESSQLVLVDLTEKGVGVGIEAGFAAGRQIPIVVIAEKGAEISQTLQGIAAGFWWYDSPQEVAAFLRR